MILTDDEKKALAQEVKTILVAESLSIDELDKVESLDGVASLPSHLTQDGLTKVVIVPIALLRKPAEDAAAATEEVIGRAEDKIVETEAAREAANKAVESVEVVKTEANAATQEARDAAASVDASKQQAEEAAAAANKATESAYKSADDADAATVILAATGKKLQEDVGAAIANTVTAITNAETATTNADEAAGRVEDFIIEAGTGLVTPEERDKWNKGGGDHTHVANHIIQDTTHRFTTDDEKTNWNGKAAAVHTHTKAQISDFPVNMPASDVYSWAKAATKPAYNAAEIGAATTGHNHTGVYQPVGSYAAAGHNHDGTYATANHNHNGTYQPVGSYAAAGHNHDADQITETGTRRFITPELLSKLAGLGTDSGWLNVQPTSSNSTITDCSGRVFQYREKNGILFCVFTVDLKKTGNATINIPLPAAIIARITDPVNVGTTHDMNFGFSVYRGVFTLTTGTLITAARPHTFCFCTPLD